MESRSAKPGEGGLAERRKSFSDLVTRTGRFIVSTLVTLVVLSVVVEQQVREYDKKLERQQQIQAAADRDLRKARARMKKRFASLPDFLYREDEKNKQLRDEIKLERFLPPKPQLLASRKGLEEVEKYLGEYLPKLQARVRESEPQVGEKVEAAQKAQMEALGGRTAAAQKKAEELERKAYTLEEFRQGLVRAPDALTEYRDSIRARGVLAEKKVAAAEEVRKLTSEKKSIPTPFGGFDLLPKLALYVLALAAMITYFMVNLSVLRARGQAREFYAASGGRQVISSPDPAPAWLYSTEPDADGILGWGRPRPARLALAAAFHALWLLLTGWLTWESLVRWDSTDAIPFGFRWFWDYALAGCFAAAAAVASWHFAPQGIRRALTSARGYPAARGTSAGRRAFVKVWSLVVLGAAAGSAAVVFRPASGRAARRDYVGRAELKSRLVGGGWVVNKRTNVLHHTFYCRHPLPREYELIDPGDPAQRGVRLHTGRAPLILAGLAKRTYVAAQSAARRERNMARAGGGVPARPGAAVATYETSRAATLERNLEDAVRLMQRAIGLSPHSFHLYDRLIKIYRHQRRYDDILPLLAGALADVEAEMAVLGQVARTKADDRRLERLKAVRKGFKSRLDGAEKKARDSFVKRYERFRELKEREEAGRGAGGEDVAEPAASEPPALRRIMRAVM